MANASLCFWSPIVYLKFFLPNYSPQPRIVFPFLIFLKWFYVHFNLLQIKMKEKLICGFVLTKVLATLLFNPIFQDPYDIEPLLKFKVGPGPIY